MQIKRSFINTIIFSALLGLGTSAQATIWNIDAVLTGAGVNGFGASSFHRASDSTPMSGSNLGNITAGSGLFGTWDDVTGTFDATLALTGAGGPAVVVTGNLSFGSNTLNSYLDTVSILTVDFLGADLFLGSNDGDIYFKPGHICCEAIEGPNSIINDTVNGGKIITLWGANGYNNGTYAGGGDTDLGMDLRIHLTQAQVPEPASMIIMGLGLLGLGFGRRVLPVS